MTLVLFVLALPLYGFTHISGDTVEITTEIQDDVYAFGNNVHLLTDLPQDFVSAGGNVRVGANVGADLIAAGGTVHVLGNVGEVARIAGGRVNIDSEIANDLVVAGGQVNIKRDALIGADLVVNGGRVHIDGDIRGRIIANGGTIYINGPVGQDAIINQVGKLDIGPAAVLEGDLRYASNQQASIDQQAQIAGEIDYTFLERPFWQRRITPIEPLALLTATFLGGKLVSFFSLFILGILLMLFIPRAFERFNQRMSASLGKCAGTGAIALLGTPLAILVIFLICVFLFITVIGSGTGLMLLASNLILGLVYLIFVYTSTVFLSYLLGRKILSKTSLNFNRFGWKVLAYFIGLVILSAAFALPFIGWLVRFAAMLFGVGALVLVANHYMAPVSRNQ